MMTVKKAGRITLVLIILVMQALGQSYTSILDQAFEQLKKDSCLTKAVVSFALLDTRDGRVLYDHNKDALLAPASTLKTFTTACALSILGEDYRYKTPVHFTGFIKDHVAYGQLWITGSGDPSLGSGRYDGTGAEDVYRQIGDGLKKLGIRVFKGSIRVRKDLYIDEAINKGWLAEDIGNYYGAGIYALNWKENKFDITLVPTQTSFRVSNNTAAYDNNKHFCVELVHKDGAGTEEAYAFVEKKGTCRYVIRGVLAKKAEPQGMQLARLDPDQDLIRDLGAYLKRDFKYQYAPMLPGGEPILLTTLYSPPLKDLVYWCNQKSLNLYAESFCKTMAVHFLRKGSWQWGLAAMLRYAASLKLDVSKVSLMDGCGLATANRITTYILAGMLQRYTKEKAYESFHKSLPSINGLIMKSGYIGGTRSYAGYVKLKDSTDACFAFIMHNYTCSPREVKAKMFQLLDKIK